MVDPFGCIDSFFTKHPDVLHWGVATTEPIEHAEDFRQWLADGRHGEMAYLENNLEMRLKPRNFFPEAESIVLFLHRCPQPILDPAAESEARVAAYACGPDYHHQLKALIRDLQQSLLKGDPTLKLKAFVDSAPVMERDLAVRARLGWFGKNSMLLHPKHGSHFFIGGFFLNRRIAKDQPAIPDRCGTCRRCIEACPTSAISDSRQINATRCISYLTIEQKGEIDPNLGRKMGNHIFGCDTCQQVCPWNQKHLAQVPPPASKFQRTLDDWLKILQPGGGFKRLFKETPLYRSGRKRLLRNVELAIGNRSGR